MINTTCAACAKPIAQDASSRCAGCQTRYCSERCERYDRRRGGHGKICGAIASGGGAEQYHADKKYEEAVAVTVEECAEDTEGWYARALFLEGEDLSEAENVLEDVWRRSKRVLSDSHPDTERARKFLEDVRSARADAAEES